MTDQDSSGPVTAIVAIVAIIVIAGVAYFALQTMQNQKEDPSIQIPIPQMGNTSS